ncbi:hypothetical protein BU17DRAFT_95876 [Hysterangium stoloniferum]|nr:hypothetical protein BU17DRAFT_95876 [Hysterangium stoloniferum]
MVLENLCEENAKRQVMEEKPSVDDKLEALKRFQSPTENLRIYLSRATLPYMTPGPTTPPFSLDEKYKVHRNHLQIRVQEHRERFIKVMAAKDSTAFANATSKFSKLFPNGPLDVPNQGADTGYAFTVPAFDFRIPETLLPHPTNLVEIMTWVNTFPTQTMARVMHAVFPEQTRSWNVTTVNDNDPDKALWQMLAWRKAPGPSRLDEFYRAPPPDPLATCSMLIVVQPPWILSPGDIRAFVKSRGMPLFNVWEPETEVPMTGAQRMWAKVYSVLPHDSRDPTVLEGLTFHVACSMGIVEASLPEALEGSSHIIGWDKIEIPEPLADPDMEFPDSESEWEGCDDEPGISASVSQYTIVGLSAFGSEQNFNVPPVQLPRHPNPPGEPLPSDNEDVLISVASPRVTRGIQRWNELIENGHRELPPIPERPRSASPVSVSGASDLYTSLRRRGLATGVETRVDDPDDPDMEFVLATGTRVHLGLGTIDDQGPVNTD